MIMPKEHYCSKHRKGEEIDHCLCMSCEEYDKAHGTDGVKG